MDDGESLQLAQEFELVGVAKPGAELEGMNWIHVQSNFIGKICEGRQGPASGTKEKQ